MSDSPRYLHRDFGDKEVLHLDGLLPADDEPLERLGRDGTGTAAARRVRHLEVSGRLRRGNEQRMKRGRGGFVGVMGDAERDFAAVDLADAELFERVRQDGNVYRLLLADRP